MNKINVGILNFQNSSHNYGAVLQAAALSQYIKNNFNVNSEHIDYVLDSKPSKAKIIHAKFKNLLMFLKLKKPRIINITVNNQETFEKFRENWLPRSDALYSSYDDLVSAKLNYTHVIVGSDQVWRPKYSGNNPLVFFLNFVSPEVKRISYAASFGVDNWEASKGKIPLYKNEIKKIDHISVREKSALKICSEIFDVKAVQVLDPTLLIGKGYFEKIINASKNSVSSGIVYYKLSLDNSFNNLVHIVEDSLSCNSKNIYMEGGILNHRYIDVPDWLNYLKSSRMIITDSFHCVCFAILFEKPVIYYPNKNRGMTRVESLFELLEIESCIFQEGQEIDYVINNAMGIDYSKVHKLLAKLRLKSHDFLKKSLE